jgi:peptidoglycan glycosyltransferase
MDDVKPVLAALICAAGALAADLPAAARRAMGERPGTAVALDAATGRLLAARRIEVAARRLARPGSAIKPFTLLALGGGPEALPCARKLEIGPRRLDCSHPRVPGPLDAVAALAYSCNSYFAARAARLRGPELVDTFTRAGLISPTGLYHQEAAGEIAPPAGDNARRLLALGESNIVVTPLAMAAAYRKLALRPPPAVLAGLVAATGYGTARLASPPGIQVAGKTGTASDPATGRVHAWFAGWAPAAAPKVVVVVFLEQGSGGRDAAPIAAEIFRAALE